jgi:hypothetical protein
MATKFPRRRSATWIPFVRNHSVLTAIVAVLLVPAIHNLVLELVIGGILIVGNSVPIRHHIVTEWLSILVQKRAHWLTAMFSRTKGSSGRSAVANEVTKIDLGIYGSVTVSHMAQDEGLLWYDDKKGARFAWIGVWLIPATSHLLLLSDAEQHNILMQWGRLLSSLAGQSVKRMQFLTDVIVTAAVGPKEVLRRLCEEDPNLDEKLVARYREVTERVGDQVYDRRSYLVVEFSKIGLGETEALKSAVDQTERTIKGLVPTARLLDPDELIEVLSGAQNPQTAFLRLLLGYYAPDLTSLTPVRYDLASSTTDMILPYHVSRTYVIGDFPQVYVPQTWQLNLLGGIPPNVARYAISYTWTVGDPTMALRQAEREANKVEMETLTRASGRGTQRIMTREYAEMDAARQTEADLTTGEAILKGIGTITITADSTRILDEAETWLYRQAGMSYLSLRRADWRHDEGWTTSLPLAIIPPYFETHTLSTKQAQSLYQAQIASPLQVPGILLGRDDLSGAPYSWDPFELYARQIITSPIAIVLGQVGTGKSTFSKLLALRGAGVHGYGFFALDPKGEYADTARELDLPYLMLAPGKTRINPLDLDSPSAKATMLAILAASVMDRNPSPDEAAAIDKVAELLPDRATLADAIDVLRAVPPEVSYAMGVPTRKDAVQRLIPVVAGLQRYLGSGQLGGLFDGETSVSINPRGMIINLSEVFREPALFKPVSNVVAFWLRNAISHLEQRSFLIVDEGWAILDNLAAFLQTTTKLSRSYGVSLVLTMHGLSDVLGAANTGTATAGKLQTVVDAVQSAFIFSNSGNEISAIGETFALTNAERSILNLEEASGNYRGLFLSLIGSHHYLCRTVLATADSETTNTDQNMAATLQTRQGPKPRTLSTERIFTPWE